MKKKYLKTIFIIFITILMLSVIWNNFFKENKEVITTSEWQSKNRDIITSTEIRIGIIEFDIINPILSNNKNVQDISRLIFDPLFSLTEDYKLEGVLATECSKIDKRTYIIKLNENISWQDGKKFDISDVIFTINMLKKIKTDSIYYYNVKNIMQLQEIDEYTLKILTDSDIPYFEYNLIFPIVSSKYFKEDDFKVESKNIKPVGTGMFYISEVNNDMILLKKNTKKVDTNEIKIDTITLNLYDSLASVVQAFKSEQIDIFTTSNKNIEQYIKNTNYNIAEYINRNYEYIALNCNSKILSNKEVRQAINYAIDKVQILRNVYSNRCKQSNFPLDFGSYAYDINNSKVIHDNNMATKTLSTNGWKYSDSRWIKNNYLNIELELVVDKNDSNMVKVANNIQEQLKSVGIIINIKETTGKQYNNYLKNENYDMIIVNSTYGYSPSLEKYFGEDNLANYNSKEVNALLSEAEMSNDEKEVKQKYTRIVEIYNEEVPYISLYYDTNVIVYSDNLKGEIRPNSYNLFYGIEEWYREYEKK